ncbi:MAG: serine/threonine-protein kinase, partial [Myxococcota bacterium]
MASDARLVNRRIDPGSIVEPGELIGGRYRVEEMIAKGGQASVWKASQEPLQRPVALKILTPPPTREDEEPFQERFLLEAKTLASLTHPNIVVVYDYGAVREGSYYIAMEYVEGVRFSSILRERPLTVQRVLRLIYQVCKALRYAHNQGVIHRDVKNANILIQQTEDGDEIVKVVDFGIVKLKEADAGITQEGVILGSPHFMSPEQVRGDFFDHRADIYAVGILLYCGVVGRYPFRGRDARAIMSAHLHKSLPRIKVRDERLNNDENFKDIIRKCLAKSPEDRFADMDTLMNALGPYIDNHRPPDPVTLDPSDFKMIAEPIVEIQDDDPESEEDDDSLEDEVTVQAEMGLFPFHEAEELQTQQMEALIGDIGPHIVEPETGHFVPIRDEPPSKRGRPRNLADLSPTPDEPSIPSVSIGAPPRAPRRPVQLKPPPPPPPEPASEM